ncbi:hypothetical protein RHSIM_Rhsim07G0135600 [Rhododendron simsii]|uniref:3-dehydroquinate synthase C-terminal domain-containing protein n=1 Tax=Rhododendron simsii TaxID=118357 RepID=A0A834GP77_RHOSS|nr:hypothetical protein RHSIM_Rhsim07G0135600 [Rhododendron simsii]
MSAYRYGHIEQVAREKELASGFAEVIKYGLIRDVEFFEWQEKNMKALMSRDGYWLKALMNSYKSAGNNNAVRSLWCWNWGRTWDDEKQPYLA